MGLADRDYMRDRYRQRGPSTAWAGKDRGRWPFRPHPLQGPILLLCALPIAIGAFQEAKRAGWVPDMHEELPFPASGDVTVSNDVDPRDAVSRFTVQTADAHAVAQLFDLEGRHVISVYVRRNDEVTTPVPPGVYRLKVAEGRRWYGPGRFFGRSMTYETAVATMRFTRREGKGIDLHRTPAGDLHTRTNIDAPSF